MYLNCLHAWLTRFSVVVSLLRQVGRGWSARVWGVSTAKFVCPSVFLSYYTAVFLYFCLTILLSFCLFVFKAAGGPGWSGWVRGVKASQGKRRLLMGGVRISSWGEEAASVVWISVFCSRANVYLASSSALANIYLASRSALPNIYLASRPTRE